MPAHEVCSITNVTQANLVCQRALRAVSLRTRLLGLLGHSDLDADSGLLLTPSSGVHTFGMRFALDIIALDSDMRVIGLWEHVGAGRVRALSLRTRSVLEMKSGQISQSGVALGDQLSLTSGTHTKAA